MSLISMPGRWETAFPIVTLKPQNFLQGRLDGDYVLPHAQVEILDSTGMPLAAHPIGSIVIKASSIATISTQNDG